MDATACWLLTDEEGRTLLGRSCSFCWNRGVTFSARGQVISGYASGTLHLPYLLDPMYERYGPKARVWLSEVVAPQYCGSNRVESAMWTALAELKRPAWVGAPQDVRVRLRLALLASADAHPDPEIRGRLRTLRLDELQDAAEHIGRVCSDSREGGMVPLTLAQTAMAVRAAARHESGDRWPVDVPARRYPIHAWYAAMAAACACIDLSGFAEMAVDQEAGARALAEVSAAGAF